MIRKDLLACPFQLGNLSKNHRLWLSGSNRLLRTEALQALVPSQRRY